MLGELLDDSARLNAHVNATLGPDADAEDRRSYEAKLRTASMTHMLKVREEDRILAGDPHAFDSKEVVVDDRDRVRLEVTAAIAKHGATDILEDSIRQDSLIDDSRRGDVARAMVAVEERDSPFEAAAMTGCMRTSNEFLKVEEVHRGLLSKPPPARASISRYAIACAPVYPASESKTNNKVRGQRWIVRSSRFMSAP